MATTDPAPRRARPPRHCRRRRDERNGRRRHRYRGDRETAGSSSRRRRDEAAERDARRRDRSVGLRLRDDTMAAPASSSSPAKKPRLRSEVGLVRGCLWRLEPFSPADDAAAGVPAKEDGVAVAVAPTSPSSRVVVPAEECGGAGTAPSSSTAAPPATTNGVFFACQVSISAPAPPQLSSQTASQALIFTGGTVVAAPPPRPPITPACPRRMDAMAIPCTSRPAYAAAIPAIPPFPRIHAPRQQPDADPDELRRAKVERFAGLIARKQQETDEHYRKLLRSGQAPPEPPKPVVDEESLRLIAARERFRETLAQEERKALGAALFVQMARPEHLRALGIDQAMELVVSPERPRDKNGAPVLSPGHPCSPLEKLGYFLKAE